MQTSLSRRQRRRRNGSGHRPSSGRRAVAGVAIAIPLFLFASLCVAGVVGFVGAVTAFSYYSQGLPDPKDVFANIHFDEETRVYDRSGKVLLATFARQRRDVVTFDEIPPVVLDATTSVEDKTFWENSGFDPIGIVSSGTGSCPRPRSRQRTSERSGRSSSRSALPRPSPAQRARRRSSPPT
jgi:membrane peptidoglycan carboxypeptidase